MPSYRTVDLDRDLAAYRAARDRRRAMVAAAFALSPAVLAVFSWGPECIVLSREMSRPDEGPMRITRFREDGPAGHHANTREKIVDYLAADYPESCRAMTEAEVMAWTCYATVHRRVRARVCDASGERMTPRLRSARFAGTVRRNGTMTR